VHPTDTRHPTDTLLPDRTALAAMTGAVTDLVLGSLDGPERPVDVPGPAADGLAADLLAPPPERPTGLAPLLARLEAAAAQATDVGGAGFLAYTPSGGLFASALGEFYARATNRYATLSVAAPGLAAMEHGVVRWLAGVLGLGPDAGGVLLSGGSLANLTALVTARQARLGEPGPDTARGTLYAGADAHHSIAKAARLAGLPASAVRVVPSGPDLRMDPAAAAALIAADRAAGLRPFLLVGTAGTTATGTVDPLAELAALAAREDLWYHVDGAYGGLFRLTGRGRQRLAGIERADSVTVDPHKSLFLPCGTGALLVRDPAALRAAHAVGGPALHDVAGHPDLPDLADLGPELTREARGPRLWLPLHLYGVAAFRAALDEKLDLAEAAHGALTAVPGLVVPRLPDLTVVAFRLPAAGPDPDAGRAADAANAMLLAEINATGRVMISSAPVGGRLTLRLCILSPRTRARHVDEAVALIARAARTIRAARPGRPAAPAPATSAATG
jgi:aromatic-L-amino-acid/L-tryptophan decarboxylase